MMLGCRASYPKTISQSIVLDHFDFELKDHRAPVEIPVTSNKQSDYDRHNTADILNSIYS